MVRNSLTIFLVVFTIYSCCLTAFIPDDMIRGENQWSDNRLRAEKYIYDNKNDELLIAGSSLSRRLVLKQFPAETFNLSMTGRSALDSLAIIVRSGATPKYVFLETNFINRPLGTKFIEALFNPVMKDIKYYLPALREKGRPSVVFSSILKRLRDNRLRAKENRSSIKQSFKKVVLKNDNDSDGIKVKNIAVEREIVKQMKKPNLNQSLVTLDKYLELLSQRGSKIIFFEMPIYKDICNYNHMKSIRSAIHKRFSS